MIMTNQLNQLKILIKQYEYAVLFISVNRNPSKCSCAENNY